MGPSRIVGETRGRPVINERSSGPGQGEGSGSVRFPRPHLRLGKASAGGRGRGRGGARGGRTEGAPPRPRSAPRALSAQGGSRRRGDTGSRGPASASPGRAALHSARGAPAPRAISILASTYLPFLLFGNKIGPVGPLAVSETEGCLEADQDKGRMGVNHRTDVSPRWRGRSQDQLVCAAAWDPRVGGCRGRGGRSRMQTWWRPSPLPAPLPATLTSPGLLGLLGQPTDSRPCFLPHEPLPTPTPCPTHPGVSGLQPGVGFPESWLAADVPWPGRKGVGVALSGQYLGPRFFPRC